MSTKSPLILFLWVITAFYIGWLFGTHIGIRTAITAVAIVIGVYVMLRVVDAIEEPRERR